MKSPTGKKEALSRYILGTSVSVVLKDCVILVKNFAVGKYIGNQAKDCLNQSTLVRSAVLFQYIRK